MMLAVASVAAQQESESAPDCGSSLTFPELCWGLAAVAFAGQMALLPTGGVFGLIAGLQFHQSTPVTVAKLALQGVVVTLLVLPAVFAGPRPGCRGDFLRRGRSPGSASSRTRSICGTCRFWS